MSPAEPEKEWAVMETKNVMAGRFFSKLGIDKM